MQNGQIIRQRILKNAEAFLFIFILILDVNLHQTMLECSGVNLTVSSVHNSVSFQQNDRKTNE